MINYSNKLPSFSQPKKKNQETAAEIQTQRKKNPKTNNNKKDKNEKQIEKLRKNRTSKGESFSGGWMDKIGRPICGKLKPKPKRFFFPLQIHKTCILLLIYFGVSLVLKYLLPPLCLSLLIFIMRSVKNI